MPVNAPTPSDLDSGMPKTLPITPPTTPPKRCNPPRKASRKSSSEDDLVASLARLSIASPPPSNRHLSPPAKKRTRNSLLTPPSTPPNKSQELKKHVPREHSSLRRRVPVESSIAQGHQSPHPKFATASRRGFYTLAVIREWIDADIYLPDSLTAEAKDELVIAMQTPISENDTWGYIYCYEILEYRTDTQISLKVGRAECVTRRFREWEYQCGLRILLRGWWPQIDSITEERSVGGYEDEGETDCRKVEGREYEDDSDDGDDSSDEDYEEESTEDESEDEDQGEVEEYDLDTSPVMSYRSRLAGPPAKWSHLLEKLVHIELKHRALSKRSDECNGPRCEKKHQEVFNFARVRGIPSGGEWDAIVRPVIERWSEFVNRRVRSDGSFHECSVMGD